MTNDNIIQLKREWARIKREDRRNRQSEPKYLTEAEISALSKAKMFLIPCVVCFWILLIAGCQKGSYAGDLSTNFSRHEFNQKQEGYALPLDQVKVDPELIRKLELLRTAIGNKPIKIKSGYRSPWYNANRTTGAKHSQHMFGKAADIMVDGMTAEQLEPYAKKVGFTFTQTYKRLPHLHVDVREKKERTLNGRHG